jgi:hypothetical protein
MSRCVCFCFPAASLTLALAIAGCNRAPSADDFEKEKKHLLHVAELASQYSTATKKPPKSIDDLKAWALKEGKATEDEFIALRDKQPYGLASGMGLIVYEQTGKNGRCYLFQAGAFREVPQAQVADLAKAGARSMTMPKGPPGMK